MFGYGGWKSCFGVREGIGHDLSSGRNRYSLAKKHVNRIIEIVAHAEESFLCYVPQIELWLAGSAEERNVVYLKSRWSRREAPKQKKEVYLKSNC